MFEISPYNWYKLHRTSQILRIDIKHVYGDVFQNNWSTFIFEHIYFLTTAGKFGEM